MSKQAYLGDSVYIEMDDYCGMVKLTTNNGCGDSNTIYLDDRVVNGLIRWWEQVVQESNEQSRTAGGGG